MAQPQFNEPSDGGSGGGIKTVQIPSNMSVLTSNHSGEYLELFVQKIVPRFVNDLNKAHDTESESAETNSTAMEAINLYMSPKPIRLTLTGFLAHPPAPGKTVEERAVGGAGFRAGVGENTWGSFERPVDLYEIGRRFANMPGTFQFQSPAYPGVVFNDLLIEVYEPSADNKKFNVYPVTIVLQSVLLNDSQSGAQGFIIETIARGEQELLDNDSFLGNFIPEGMSKLPEPVGSLLNNVSDVVQDPMSGLFDLVPEITNVLPQQAPTDAQTREAEKQKDWFQQAVDFMSQPDALSKIENAVDQTAEMIGVARQAPAKIQQQVQNTMRKVEGWMHLITGSLPAQSFRVRVGEKRVAVFIHWEQGVGRGFITVDIDDERILTEFPLVLNGDIFRVSQWHPSVKGLHITPKALVGDQELTEDNIGKKVFLMVETDIL